MRRAVPPMDAPRCSYCHDQAVVWIDYPDKRGAEGRRVRKGYQVGACEDHKGCVNFQSHIELCRPRATFHTIHEQRIAELAK